MKLKNVGKLLGIGTMAFIMAGCGGSSGSSGGSSTPPPPTSVPGGDASIPAVLSFDLKNEISTNTAYNYFQYTGIEDTKLVIHATLDRELTRGEKVSSQYMGNSFIKIYDAGLNSLPGKTYGTDLTYVLPYDGTFIIKFDYPTSGYANVSEIKPY